MAKEWNLRQCFWCSCLRPQICVRLISRSIVEGKNKDLFAVLPKHKANNGTFSERSNNSKLVHSLNRMQQLRCQSPSLGKCTLSFYVWEEDSYVLTDTIKTNDTELALLTKYATCCLWNLSYHLAVLIKRLCIDALPWRWKIPRSSGSCFQLTVKSLAWQAYVV